MLNSILPLELLLILDLTQKLYPIQVKQVEVLVDMNQVFMTHTELVAVIEEPNFQPLTVLEETNSATFIVRVLLLVLILVNTNSPVLIDANYGHKNDSEILNLDSLS